MPITHHKIKVSSIGSDGHTEDLLNAAANAYGEGRFSNAAELIDAAMSRPDAPQYAARIRKGRELVAEAGGWGRYWTPPMAHWKRCPALSTACPHADADCAGEVCALREGGWE